MPDNLVRTRVDGGYLERLPAFQPGDTFVGWLSAAARIEAGPVAGQAFPLDCGDDRFRFEAVAILEVNALGGRHAHNFTANPATWVVGLIWHYLCNSS